MKEASVRKASWLPQQGGSETARRRLARSGSALVRKQQPPRQSRREDYDDDVELVLPGIKECQACGEDRHAHRQRWHTFSSDLRQVDGGCADQADYPSRDAVQKGVQPFVLHDRLQPVVENQ